MNSRRTTALSLLADAALLVVFVLIGRASHDENPVLGALVTLWPFLAGLVVGWLVCRAWRAPLAVVRTGIPVWACTVIVGMVLRAVSGQGVQLSFIVVTCIVLAVFLLGWRAIAQLVVRRRSSSDGCCRSYGGAEQHLSPTHSSRDLEFDGATRRNQSP